jgi:hypothetical protein
VKFSMNEVSINPSNASRLRNSGSLENYKDTEK